MIVINKGIQWAAYTVMSKFSNSLLLNKNIVYSETSEEPFLCLYRAF